MGYTVKNRGNETKEIIFITDNLQDNIEQIKKLFVFPANKDIIFRDIYVKTLGKTGVVIYLEGAADKKEIEQFFIQPLIEKQMEIGVQNTDEALKKLLPGSMIKSINSLNELVVEVISGSSVLLVDGFDNAFSFSAINFQHRPVEHTRVENVLKGPKEAFVESIEINTSLIRKRIKSPNLVNESIAIGQTSYTPYSLFYLKDVANEELVNKIKDKITKIKVDGMVAITQLEQYLEERPYSLAPTVLFTERPDRAAAFLLEGHIVLIGDSAGCLILPVTFWSFFHTAEDYYQRWAYSNFIRILRLIAFFITLLLPSFYIAATNFHVEMIPTDLMLSIAASRELVPFPAIFELLLMEIAFELMREAGSHVLTTLGTTISIVGSLIIAEAGVQSGIISPILIIVVALTGLASYVIAEYSTSYMIRIGRFIFLIFALTYGFLGISVFLAISISYLATIKSFGVPFLSPVAPYYPASKDTIYRDPLLKQRVRPFYMKIKDTMRQQNNPEEQNDSAI